MQVELVSPNREKEELADIYYSTGTPLEKKEDLVKQDFGREKTIALGRRSPR